MYTLTRTVITVALVACGGSGKPVASSSGSGDRAVVTETVIEILDHVQFTDDGQIIGSGYQTLDAVAATLKGNPGILLVEIQGRVVDDDGQPESGRQERAQKRADLIAAYLVKAGVEAERLKAQGYTDLAKPAASHVSFMILERSEPTTVAASPDARAASPTSPPPVAEQPVAGTPVTSPSTGTPVTSPSTATPPVLPPAGSQDSALIASRAFIKLVTDAKPGFNRCHQAAVSANPKLANTTVSLQLVASFVRTGAFKSATMTPSLGGAFDECMKSVMAGWSLGAQTEDLSFQTTVTLRP